MCSDFAGSGNNLMEQILGKTGTHKSGRAQSLRGSSKENYERSRNMNRKKYRYEGPAEKHEKADQKRNNQNTGLVKSGKTF